MTNITVAEKTQKEQFFDAMRKAWHNLLTIPALKDPFDHDTMNWWDERSWSVLDETSDEETHEKDLASQIKEKLKSVPGAEFLEQHFCFSLYGSVPESEINVEVNVGPYTGYFQLDIWAPRNTIPHTHKLHTLSISAAYEDFGKIFLQNRNHPLVRNLWGLRVNELRETEGKVEYRDRDQRDYWKLDIEEGGMRLGDFLVFDDEGNIRATEEDGHHELSDRIKKAFLTDIVHGWTSGGSLVPRTPANQNNLAKMFFPLFLGFQKKGSYSSFDDDTWELSRHFDDQIENDKGLAQAFEQYKRQVVRILEVMAGSAMDTYPGEELGNAYWFDKNPFLIDVEDEKIGPDVRGEKALKKAKVRSDYICRVKRLGKITGSVLADEPRKMSLYLTVSQHNWRRNVEVGSREYDKVLETMEKEFF